jgi:hypothetical protein
MTVDFNNLRKQTAYSLDRVIKILNAGILPEKEFASHTLEGKTKNWEGNVLVDAEDLQRQIDDLRQNVGFLLCVFEKGNPDFKEVWQEVEDSGGIAWFNSDDEE